MKSMENTSARQTNRLWHLDVLRILAILCVVLRHVSPQASLDVPVQSASWQVMNLLSSLSVWSVPVLFMVSGALFLSPQRPLSVRRLYRHSVLRLITSFCFWSALYALVWCMATGRGKWTFLNQLLRGHYHMWFIFELIGLYCITPLLRQITASRRATGYLLLAGLAFSFVPSRLLGFAFLFPLPHEDVFLSLQSAFAQMNPYRSLSCAYYFVLGHYLNETAFSRRSRGLLLGAGAAALAATFLLTSWHSGLTGATSAHFYANDSLNVLLMSAAAFVLCREWLAHHPPGERQKALLLRLSACSYGIYLIHPLLIERLPLAFPLAPVSLAACILGVTAAVCLISFTLSYLLNRVPILKRFIV